LIPNISSRVVRVEERMELGVGSKEQGQEEQMNTEELRLLGKEDEQCSVTNYLMPSLALPSGISSNRNWLAGPSRETGSQAQYEYSPITAY
jgi:hypothetical protein